MPEERRARIGLLGAGWWGCQVYIPQLLDHPDVELVAVSRLERDDLEAIQGTFGIPAGYVDHNELLERERPDAVVVCSPHIAHYEQARAALEAGAHVLVDKPMTTRADHARSLVGLASERGLKIILPYGWNYKDFTRKAARLMQDGRVGTVRHVVCQMASPTADLFGGQGLMETADHMYRPSHSTWADPDKAGGYGWGQLSHALGLLFRLVDLAPQTVFALGGKSPTGVDYYDAVAVRLSGGATAAISGASTVPKQCGNQLDIRVFGTEGMLLLDVERERMELRRNDGDDVVLEVPEGAGAYQCVEPVSRLADIAFGRDRELEAPGIVGMRAVEVLDAMYRSMASGMAEGV